MIASKQHLIIYLLLSLSLHIAGEEYSLPIYSFRDSTITMRLQQWLENSYDTIGTQNLSLTIGCAGYMHDSKKLYFNCALRHREDLPYIASKRDSVGSGIALLENEKIAYLVDAELWQDIVIPCGRDTMISLSNLPTSPLSLSYFSINYLPPRARLDNFSVCSDIRGDVLLSYDSSGNWYYHLNDTCSKEVALYGPTRDSTCVYLNSYIDNLIYSKKLNLFSSRRPWSVDADVFCLFFDADKKLSDVRVINCDSNRQDDCEGSQRIAGIILSSKLANLTTMDHYPCVYLYAFRMAF